MSIAGFLIVCITGVLWIFGAVWRIIELPEMERKVREFRRFLDSIWIEEMIENEERRKAIIKRLRMEVAMQVSVGIIMGILLILVAFEVI